jgi:PDZ domain
MKTNLVWLLMLALGATVPAAQAQDDDNKKEEKQQAHKARVVVVDKQDQDEDDDQEGKAGDHGVRSATQVRVEDGKLVVIDNEGNRQEFDISGAQGLTISSSTTEEERDGERKSKSVGKAIIVGPDGEKTEIEFDGVIDMEDMPQFQLRRGPLQARMRMIPDPAAPLGVLGGGEEGLANLDVVGGKYFIGVMCEAVDEETADELELEEASGLIVREVTEDSPAAKAGIESGDVLLLADDTELTEAAELVEVVQKAGEEGNHLTLTLLRDGNEEHIRVEPAERDMEQLGRMQFQMAPGMEGEGNFNLQFLPDMHALKAQLGDLQQLGPALMLEAQDLANNPELKAEIEEAMQEMRAEFEAAAAEMKEELQNAAEELRAQMEEFRAQIEGSREQLSRQKEELDRLRENRPRRGGDRDEGTDGDGGELPRT